MNKMLDINYNFVVDPHAAVGITGIEGSKEE